MTVPVDLGCPQNFMSMGLSAIHFPKDKVLQACASRLARQIVLANRGSIALAEGPSGGALFRILV